MTNLGTGKLGVVAFGFEPAEFAHQKEVDGLHDPLSIEPVGVFDPSEEQIDGRIITGDE